MGGRSSANTTNTSTNVRTTRVNSKTKVDNSQKVQDQTDSVGSFAFGDVRGAGGVTINQTDGGAFDFARDMGMEAFGFGESAFSAIDSAGQRATAAAQGALSQVAGLTESLKGGGANQKTVLLLVGGTLAAITLVVVAFNHGGKS